MLFKVFQSVKDKTGLKLFESGKRTQDKQETHTMDATKLVEYSLKSTLLGLAKHLFGKGKSFMFWANLDRLCFVIYV